MKKNVGEIDKLVRLIFALVFFIMGMLYNPLWLAVSILLLLTAIFGTCGLYHVGSINTRHKTYETKPQAKVIVAESVAIVRAPVKKKSVKRKPSAKAKGKAVKKTTKRKSSAKAKRKPAKKVVAKKKLAVKKKSVKRKPLAKAKGKAVKKTTKRKSSAKAKRNPARKR